jgi:pimeloyl-ACP methyl ester carboxylesterase
VFVHGAGGTAAAWDAQRLAFPRAVAVTLPGHGGGPDGTPGLRRVDDYATWLHGTLHERGWIPAVLAGQSMGGAIALAYALAHAEDLAALVLIATGARLRVAPEILAGLRRDYPRAAAHIVALSLAPAARGRLAERLAAAMLAVPAAVTLGDFEACDAFDVTDRLEEIRPPALVIAGREDRMTPPRYAEYLHARLPGSAIVWVEGAGHMLHVEQPRAVNDAIRRFIRGLRLKV